MNATSLPVPASAPLRPPGPEQHYAAVRASVRAFLRQEPWAAGERELAAGDWERLARLAVRHGVLPLFHASLGAARAEAPPPVLADIERWVTEQARHNLELAAGLVRASRLLAAAGIPALSFKGPLLAQELYGDLRYRPCGDVDLLVRRADALRALRIVAGAGYETRWPGAAEGGVHILRIANHLRLISRRNGTAIELHWDLAAPSLACAFELDAVWRRAGWRELGGTAITTMGLEDLALFLCFHGCKHRWERLEWLTDVAALATRAPTLDWEKVRTRARRIGIQRMVHVGLLLARAELGTPLPPGADAAGADPAASDIVEALRHRMGPQWAAGVAAPRRLSVSPLSLRLRDTLRHRAHHAVQGLVHPTTADVRTVALPARLFLLYYLIRPFRLALKYGARAAACVARAAAPNPTQPRG